jgi:ATP-binding cassette subfamily G (WHITE) protein 2 (SNQ2)
MADHTRSDEVGRQSPPSLAPTLAGSVTDDHAPAAPYTEKSTETPPPEQAPGIDVKRAEAEFEELRRQLSRASSLQRTQTGQKDVEKEGEVDDDFDLLAYMKGSKSARDQEGFKGKEVRRLTLTGLGVRELISRWLSFQVGVAWDNLTVVGGGGLKIHIRTFPDAIIEQIMSPALMVLGLFG